jgi:spore coat polysaccharide biosynthesis protein SpsF (cytidylyltransferase family)
MRNRSQILIVIQARMGSSRLPGKVILPIGYGFTAIKLMLYRLKTQLHEVIVVTSTNAADDVLIEHLSGTAPCYRGSELDVLSRFTECLSQDRYERVKTVVRLTGDCPFVDPAIVDKTLELYFDSKADYCSNIAPRSFPDGMDVEVFSKNLLFHVNRFGRDQLSREHVTPMMRGVVGHMPDLRVSNLSNARDDSNIRLTLDTREDLETIRQILKEIGPDGSFSQAVEVYKSLNGVF